MPHADIVITALPAGASYASLEDIALADDIARATVEIPRWTRAGAPLYLQLRGLDLTQQDEVVDKSRKKDRLTGEIVRDKSAFCAHTLRLACVQPQLDELQARALIRKNASVLNGIVTLVWEQLSDFIPADIEQIVQALAAIPEADNADHPDPAG